MLPPFKEEALCLIRKAGIICCRLRQKKGYTITSLISQQAPNYPIRIATRGILELTLVASWSCYRDA